MLFSVLCSHCLVFHPDTLPTMDVSHSLSYPVLQRSSPTPSSSCFPELAEDVFSSTGTERRMNRCCFISSHLKGILPHTCKYIPEGKAWCLLYLGWGELLRMLQWCLKSPNLTLRWVRLVFHQQPGGRREPFVSSRIYFQILSLSLPVLLFVSCSSLRLFSDRLFSACCFIMHFAGVFSLIYFARIDMIVGPPPPSTPRHKKYPTKGPMYSSKESPQYSPRLGFTKMPLSLEFFWIFFFHLLYVKPLSCQLYDGVSHLAVQPAKS